MQPIRAHVTRNPPGSLDGLALGARQTADWHMKTCLGAFDEIPLQIVLAAVRDQDAEIFMRQPGRERQLRTGRRDFSATTRTTTPTTTRAPRLFCDDLDADVNFDQAAETFLRRPGRERQLRPGRRDLSATTWTRTSTSTRPPRLFCDDLDADVNYDQDAETFLRRPGRERVFMCQSA